MEATTADPFGPFGVTALLSAHLVGSRVGPYRIVRLLGEGGQGAVYLAERSGQRCAVKLWGPVIDEDRTETSRLRREAEIALEVRHPSLVRVFDADIDRELGVYYLAMEYIEGAASFREVGRLAPRPAAQLVFDVLGGLSALHAAGLLHRDLKPSNVLLDLEGRAHLADLGLVADLFPVRADRAGTVRYMAPETLLDGLIEDPRSEVYSAGAMLYRLLTGGLPWKGADPWRLRVLIRATHVLSVPHAPRGLSLVVAKAMSPDPEDRYQSAAEMATDLRRWLDGKPVLAEPPPLRARVRAALTGPRVAAACAVLALAAGGFAWRTARSAHNLERDLMKDRAQIRERLFEMLPGEPLPPESQETPDGRDPNPDLHDG